jgi:hypothetical protein
MHGREGIITVSTKYCTVDISDLRYNYIFSTQQLSSALCIFLSKIPTVQSSTEKDMYTFCPDDI